MPTRKDLKRLVRRRMKKTGESYTAARAQLVRTRPAAPATLVPPAPRRDRATLAGMSDDAVKAATGRSWRDWQEALDAAGAHAWPHRRIAAHVQREFGVRDWWAQSVTVGYERIHGLREIGQRRGGAYEANRSRTFPVPAAKLFDAFTKPRTRARWLPGVRVTVRTATPHRSVRMTWEDGTSVEVWLTAKGEAKSSAQVAHRKLASREAATRSREFWGGRLDALAALLAR